MRIQKAIRMKMILSVPIYSRKLRRHFLAFKRKRNKEESCNMERVVTKSMDSSTTICYYQTNPRHMRRESRGQLSPWIRANFEGNSGKIGQNKKRKPPPKTLKYPRTLCYIRTHILTHRVFNKNKPTWLWPKSSSMY